MGTREANHPIDIVLCIDVTVSMRECVEKVKPKLLIKFNKIRV